MSIYIVHLPIGLSSLEVDLIVGVGLSDLFLLPFLTSFSLDLLRLAALSVLSLPVFSSFYVVFVDYGSKHYHSPHILNKISVLLLKYELQAEL